MSWLKTIEIAGKKILARPLETIILTSEQQKKFEEAGGLVNPTPKEAIARKNQEKMMCWTEDFEALQAEIDGTLYKGFDLFKKIYEAFSDIAGMTKKEAIEAGFYPNIYYRNFAARKWMAEMYGGHLANLDEDYDGELRDIYDIASGKTNLEKLAAMGQAPLGWRDVDDAEIYDLGLWVALGSGSFDIDSDGIRGFGVDRDEDMGEDIYWLEEAISSVVVLDK